MQINNTGSIAGQLPARGYEKSAIEAASTREHTELTEEQLFQVYARVNDVCSRTGETSWPIKGEVPSIEAILEESAKNSESTISIFISLLTDVERELLSCFLMSGTTLSDHELSLAVANNNFRWWARPAEEDSNAVQSHLPYRTAKSALSLLHKEHLVQVLLEKEGIEIGENTSMIELLKVFASKSRERYYNKVSDALLSSDSQGLNDLSNTERTPIVTSPQYTARNVLNLKYHIDKIEREIAGIPNTGDEEQKKINMALRVSLEILLKRLYQKLVSNFQEVAIMAKMYFKTKDSGREPNHDIFNALVQISGTLMGKGFHHGILSYVDVESLYREHLERINIYDRYINGVAQSPIGDIQNTPVNLELYEQTQKFLIEEAQETPLPEQKDFSTTLTEANTSITDANTAHPQLAIKPISFLLAKDQEEAYRIDMSSGEISIRNNTTDNEKIKAVNEYMATSRVKVIRLFIEKVLDADGILSSDTSADNTMPEDGKWKVRILSRSSGGMAVESALNQILIPSQYTRGLRSAAEIVAHEYMHVWQRINAQRISATSSNGESIGFTLLSRIGLGNSSQNSEAGALITQQKAKQEFSGQISDDQRANTSYVEGIMARLAGGNYGEVARAMYSAYRAGGMSPATAAKTAATRAYRIFQNAFSFAETTPGLVANSKDLAYSEQLLYTSALSSVDPEFTGVTAIAGVNFVDLAALDAVGLVNIAEISSQDTANRIVTRVKEVYDSFGIIDF